MEIILDLYEQPYDPKFPVVCFDELPGQLLADVVAEQPAEPGRPRRFDYEYERGGTYNAFMMVEPKGGWRHIEVTERRTSVDFATQLRFLAEDVYPEAQRIKLVLDNLSTHKLEALWKVYEPARALAISRCFEFIFTPTHASWLNAAEIELAALTKQCLGSHRLKTLDAVRAQIEPWQATRNELGIGINWSMNPEKSREKFDRHYDRELF
jgi:transposase